jgi:alpha-galactosidase
MLQTEDHLYVAIINYREETMTESIPYERLGISQSDYKSIKELWSGEVQKPAPDALCFEVPGHDAHIYRFDK